MQTSLSLLEYFSKDLLFAYFLIATRLGAAFIFMPGFSGSYVPLPIKIVFLFFMTVTVGPFLDPQIPSMPADMPGLVFLIVGEFLIGAFLGLLAYIMYVALEIGGMMISFQMGLGNATIFNPAMATQGSLVSVFLMITGVVIIFATNLHHLMLTAVLDSYTLFVPGNALPVGDMTDYMAQILNKSFLLAFQLSAPMLVVGLIFYLSLGLMGRLMPQVQVFFVAIPLQILLGLFVLFLTMSALFYWFLNNFEEVIKGLLDLNGF